MRRVMALARLALLAFPRKFRREHGHGLLQTFADDVRDAAGRPRWGSGLAGAWDLVRAGMTERARFAGRLRSDVWQAWRSLTARPGASIGTVLIFSLGVGLVAAMFALTDPFILRPLPYARAHELVAIELGWNKRGARVPSFEEWRDQTSLFQGLAVVDRDAGGPLIVDGRAVPFTTSAVTKDFFDVLGVPGPRATDWDTAAGVAERPLVLAPARGKVSAFGWQVGDRLVRKDGTALRVLRIAPASFLYPSKRGQPDGVTLLAAPQLASVTYSDSGRSARTEAPVVIARLQPGVTPAAVKQALVDAATFEGLAVVPLAEWLTRDLRPLAWGAFAAGVLVLFVCAGNVANIFVARGTYRLREFATREALGGSRADVVRLWGIELLILTAVAVVSGLVIGHASLFAVSTVIPEDYVVLGEPRITMRVAWVAALAGVTVAVVGFVPALTASRVLASGALGRMAAVESRRAGPFRVTFAASQSALAVVLAIGAAMLLHSYANLVGQEKGFDLDTTYVTVHFPGTQRLDEIQSSIDALKRLPGVADAAATTGRVVSETWSSRGAEIDGTKVTVGLIPVSAGYFDATGLGILQGRPLSAADRGWSAVVVNEAFARKHWPDGRVLGRLIRFSYASHGTEVVGVTRNALDTGLANPATPVVYLPLDIGWSSGTRFLVKPQDGRGPSADAIRAAILSVNVDADVGEVTTVGALLMETVRERTFATMILTFFCLAGGLVTVAGLISIVSFVVARRARELAIRSAIGATPRDIRRLVVREAVGAAIGGGAVGLLIGRWLSTWLESLVFGIDAGNWTTAIAAVAAALVIMIGAALIPARRALRLQPSQALRTE